METEKRNFDVSEGYAINTLKEAAQQADVEFIFSADLVRDVRTSSIQGNYTPLEAFSLMLVETSLAVFQHEQTGIYAIRKVSDIQYSTSEPEPKPIEETEMNTKNKSWFSKIMTGLTAAVLAGGSTTALAQEEEEKQVYELSLFEVDESEDSGYTSTSTLAGTRIKSDLRDLGASIFVATKELLDDTGSTDVEDLLVYIAGAEVAGLGGNFGASEFVSGGNTTVEVTQSPQTATRIRGLAGADLTRELFLTSIPFDSYNTSRVTVNRGPNAVLFGLGSPAGIVDNSLIKPTFSDHTNVEFKYGRFGSTRASFDVDRVLENGKLGIRIAGVYDDEKFQQEPAFERVKRGYGAFDYKLFEGEESSTTLRGHFEMGESNSNRPRTEPPGDQITGWWLNGQPTADWLMDWRDQDRTVFSIPGSTWYQIATIYDQPDATTTGGTGVPNAFTTLTLPQFVTAPVDPQLAAALAAGGRGTYLPSFRGTASYQDYAAGRAGTPGAFTKEQGGDFFIDRHITDRSIFDYRNLLLDGPTKSEYYDFDAYNIAIEQLAFNGNVGAEVAFDKQSFDNGFFGIYTQGNGIDQGSIDIDVNSNYPNGDPNPNYGRPFVSASGRAAERENDRETFRVTAFAKLNLEEKFNNTLGKILGRHTITGLFNTQSDKNFSAGFNGFAPDQNFLRNFRNTSNILDSNSSDTRVWYYLGSSLANASSPEGANISNVKSALLVPSSIPDVLAYDPEQQAFVRTPVTFTSYQNDRLGLANGASKTQNEVDSTAFIWQGHLLSDMLVGTAGWRKDKADSFTAGTPPRAADNHVLINDPNFKIDPTSISSAENETWTYSGVFHLPDNITRFFGDGTRISLHYSESENFEPATPRWNVIGDPLPAPAGVTEDIGFTLSLFNGRLIAKTSWFETAQTNITNPRIPTGMMGNLRGYYEATLRGVNDDLPAQKAFLLANLPPQEIQNFYGWEIETFGDSDPSNDVVRQSTGGRSIAGVTDRVTEGVEFELVYNPTENWTIMFNASQAKAKQTGIDKGVDSLINFLKPVWDSAPELLNSELNFRLGDIAKDSILNPWNVVLLSDGTPTTELREWRWNFITNYQFTEGIFENFSIGGAGRWLDRPSLGLPVAFSDVLDDYALDPTNPYYGSTEFNADMWVSYKRRIMNEKVEWRLQLNVRNVIGDDKLIPLAVQPDGSVVNGRIPLGTIWELSSRFSF